MTPLFIARRDAGAAHPRLVQRVPTTHDMDQHLATLEEFDAGLRDGSLYPRWQAGFDFGYGLPWLNYYQPGFFYQADLFYRILHDGLAAMLAVSIVNMALSGLTFYWFARLFYGLWPAAAGALIYMTAPYHLLDLYHRAAMPEFAAFLFAPLIFGLAFLAGRRGRPRHIAGFGLCYGLCMFAHWPSAYLLTIPLAVYALVWTIMERDWRIAARLAVGGALGLLIAAIYWVPTALEADYMQEGYTAAFPYHSSYLPLFPVKDELAGLINKCFFSAMLLLIGAIVVLSTVKLRQAKVSGRSGKRREQAPQPVTDDLQSRRHTRLLLLAGIVSLFMVTELSYFVSSSLPKIEVVQFPWRWLLPISFFASAAVSIVLERLGHRGKTSPAATWFYRAGLAVAIGWQLWLSGYGAMFRAFQNPDLKRVPAYADGIFFPRGAQPPYTLSDTPQAMLVSGEGHAKVLHWDSFRREIEITANKPDALRLRTYSFPGWQCRVDGRITGIRSDLQGAQTIEVPAGEHRVEVFFGSTPPRTAGGVISAFGLALLGGLLWVDRFYRVAL